MADFALYIHIPFCRQICPYCDFNTYAVKTIPEAEYLAAIDRELSFHKEQGDFNGKVKTIYFGGGTPSLFGSKSIQKLLDTIKKYFNIPEKIEITLEANPEDLIERDWNQYYKLGINRLSLGLQSLNDDNLKFLGRKHTSEQAIKLIQKIREIGVNLNLDLIYALPKQDPTKLLKEVEAYLKLDPQHISAYALTFEQGTPFYQARQQKKIKVIDEDAAVQCFELIMDQLNAAGYEHYEISNFAKKGFQSQHNLNYWNAEDYLGLGAGAHSFIRGKQPKRWMNIRNYKDYINLAGTADCISWQEKLDKNSEIFEFIYFSLRKIQGLNKLQFKNLFSQDFQNLFKPALKQLTEQGLLQNDQEYVRLTRQGIMLADSVLEFFVLE